MSISFHEARQIAEDRLRALELLLNSRNEKSLPISLMMVEHGTTETRYEWTFLYNSRGYLADGVKSQQLAGNAALHVRKDDGRLREEGTPPPLIIRSRRPQA